MGTFQVECDGEIRTIRSHPIRALLGYLVVAGGRAQSRERLADTVFHTHGASDRRALRQTVWRIRNDVCADLLAVDVDHVGLAEGLVVDAWQFENLAGQVAGSALGDGGAALNHARDLYRGDFLEGIYEDWALQEQRRLRLMYLDLLLRQAQVAKAAGDVRTAITTLEQLLAEAPEHEAAHRELLRTYLMSGMTRRAILEHERISLRLEEMGLEPSQATVALHDYIRSERAGAPLVDPRAQPIVGRTEERTAISQAIDGAAFGQGGRWVLIEAESGLGKSVLLREAVRSARLRGARVAYVAARDIDGPFAVIRSMVDQLVDPITLRRIYGRVDPVVAASLRTFLADGEGTSDNLVPALVQTLAVLLALETTMVAVDDADAADEVSLEVLAALGERSVRGVIAISFTRSALTPQHAFSKVLGGITQAPPVELGLEAFGPEDAAQYIERVWTGGTSSALVNELLAHSGGHPLFLGEIVRYLHAVRPEGPPPDHEIGTLLAGISDIAGAVDAQLERLSAGERTVADWLAVLDAAAPPNLLERLVDLPDADLWDAVAHLERRGLVSLDDDAPRIHHRLVAEHLRTRLDEFTTRTAHRRILDVAALEDGLLHSARLARHAKAIGDTEQAIDLLADAATDAQRVGAPLDAAAYVNQALAMAREAQIADGRISSMLSLADDLFVAVGHHDEAEAIIHRLAGLIPSADVEFRRCRLAAARGEPRRAIGRSLDAARSMGSLPEHWRIELADWYRQVGDLPAALATLGDTSPSPQWHWTKGAILEEMLAVDESLEHLDEARHAFGEAGETGLAARVGASIGAAKLRAGDVEGARQANEQSLRAFDEAGDLLGVAQAAINLATIRAIYGPAAGALELMQRARNVFQALGNTRGEAVAAANEATLRVTVLGQHRQGLEIIEQADAIFERSGDRRGHLQTASIRMMALDGLGDHAEADAIFRRVMTSASDNPWHLAQVMLTRGQILFGRGDLMSAREALEQAVEVGRAAGVRHFPEQAEALLAVVLIRAGDLTSADRYLSDVAPEKSTHVVELARSELAQATGDTARSVACLTAAHAKLRHTVLEGLDPVDQNLAIHADPIHRSIAEGYTDIAPRTVVSRFPSIQTPTGRPLTDDDFVTVEVTLSQPSDYAISERGERRRAVVQRIITEAKAAGALPRLEDLARLTEASVATVRRDLARIAGSQPLIGRSRPAGG